MNSQAEAFFNRVRLESSKIQYPQDVVFLCGGEIGRTVKSIKSLRDYIYCNSDDLLPDKTVILAEKAAEKFDARVYDDLLGFETHIAAISRVVLLVSESPGSIAELGAFSQIPEIQRRLLVFMRSDHYSQNSFIKDGPVRFLENKNELSVQEFSWLDKPRGRGIDQESVEKLHKSILSAVESFANGQPRTEKFDIRNVGHKILLVAGIICMLRVCKLSEIENSLSLLGFGTSRKEIRQYLFCLVLFGWVSKHKRETTYYVYDQYSVPVIFRASGSILDFDPIRTRFDIVKAYPDSDPRLTLLDSL